MILRINDLWCNDSMILQLNLITLRFNNLLILQIIDFMVWMFYNVMILQFNDYFENYNLRFNANNNHLTL